MIILFFLNDAEIKKVLISKKIFSDQKTINTLLITNVMQVMYLHNLIRVVSVKPLHIMLPNTSNYVRSYDGQTKRLFFFDKR